MYIYIYILYIQKLFKLSKIYLLSQTDKWLMKWKK